MRIGKSIVTEERVTHAMRMQYNPIRGLRPDKLARNLDAFHAGCLQEIARLWEAIELRDDMLATVVPKRKQAVARRPFKVLTMDESPEAQEHKKALEYFYNHVTASSAIDGDEQGGFSHLVRQMMDAIGKRYAVHEILWKPSGHGLTADFRFVPLWFFERTTGKLRFLDSDLSPKGVELSSGQWLVTVGPGLMQASCIAYMFKHLPLRDWLLYSEKHGTPGIQGKTGAPKGSAEWDAMVDAVSQIANDFSCVTSLDDKIEKIDLGATGELPMPGLVDRMDRAIAAIWRGGDLGTLSNANSTGSNPQQLESDLLETDDAILISETLNIQVDRWVIRYVFGNVEPLAYVKIVIPPRRDIEVNLKVDTFLTERGFPLSMHDVAERYGRAIARPGERVLLPTPSKEPTLPDRAPVKRLAIANEAGAVQEITWTPKTVGFLRS